MSDTDGGAERFKTPDPGRYRERQDRARSRAVTDHLTSFFPTGRDRGVTVAVEGFFAFVWFGWG